jgi:cation diffusion facilitator family transporter
MASAADARTVAVQRVLVAVLVLNLLVAAAKAIGGVWLGSLAITSDAVHSVIDAGGNVLGLIVLRFAARPADPGHPYGHHKFEVLAAAAIGAVVAFVALRFAWGAIEALLVGRPAPVASPVGFAIEAVTLAVNLGVATYEARRARTLRSSFLAADAAHTASDVLVTGAVMLSYVGVYLGFGWADPVGALVVVGFIGKVAWTILAPNLRVLTDTVMIDPDAVKRVVTGVHGVVGCHRIRSRGSPGAVAVDLHIHVDGELSLREAHDIASAVEQAIDRNFADVTDVNVHVEPASDLDAETPLPP